MHGTELRATLPPQLPQTGHPRVSLSNAAVCPSAWGKVPAAARAPLTSSQQVLTRHHGHNLQLHPPMGSSLLLFQGCLWLKEEGEEVERMPRAQLTSRRAMALPCLVRWRCAQSPVGSFSAFQPKSAAAEREQMVLTTPHQGPRGP